MINSSIYPPTYPSTVITAGTSIGIGASSPLYTNTTTNPYITKNNSVTIGDGSDSNLTVKGNAEFEGDIKLKGKSLDKTLTRIEERLAILHPNEKLEEKWENLRELRKLYMELEAEIIEKEEIWKILKR